MNTKSLLTAALATAFAATALATSKSPADLQQEAQLRAPSTVTRAQVIAELNEARANGTLNVHPDYGTRAVTGPSQLTRAQVRAEVATAMARGERLSQGDSNRNSASVHRPHDDRGPSTVASRDAAAVK